MPFKAEHIAKLARSGTESDWCSPAQAAQLEGRRSFTFMAGDEPVMCAGVLELWPGRFAAWAYPGEKAARHWKSIHRNVKAFLWSLPARRVEVQVRHGFEAGVRWAERLGFKVEAPRLERFFPDGSDAVGLAMTRSD